MEVITHSVQLLSSSFVVQGPLQAEVDGLRAEVGHEQCLSGGGATEL